MENGTRVRTWNYRPQREASRRVVSRKCMQRRRNWSFFIVSEFTDLCMNSDGWICEREVVSVTRVTGGLGMSETRYWPCRRHSNPFDDGGYKVTTSVLCFRNQTLNWDVPLTRVTVG